MKLKQYDLAMIGVRAMCGMAIGWTEGDGTGSEGYKVEDYFDCLGRYKGPDCHGIEPIFRDMNQEEINQSM